MSSNQKYALVTGGTSGIGLELARLFAKEHYNLVIVARHSEDLEKTASEFRELYQVEVVPIVKDLFKREAPFELYQEVQQKSIQVDTLVNNAGQGQYGEFADTDIHRELDLIQLNIGAYVILTKLFLQDMRERNEGKILNVSSIGGEMPGPLQAVYHATKAFVTSFTEAIRSENKGTNITITALLPGVTDTDFFRKAEQEEARLVQWHRADPAKVAKDGFEALMKGEDKVISGLANKVMVATAQMMPDSTAADMMRKSAEPTGKSKKE